MSLRSMAFAGLCLMATAVQAADLRRRADLTLRSLESDTPAVEATFNPKELSVDKSVLWTKDPASTEDEPAVQFGGTLPRTLEVVVTVEDKSVGERRERSSHWRWQGGRT